MALPRAPAMLKYGRIKLYSAEAKEGGGKSSAKSIRGLEIAQ